jgi:hypothetical protein
MANSGISIQYLAHDRINRLASQFQQDQSNSEISVGLAPKPAKVFGWSTWRDVSDGDCGIILSIASEPAVLLWLAPDDFNSSVLHVRQARIHWLTNFAHSWTAQHISELSQALLSLLGGAEWELISLRLIGHDPVAFELFQQAGFRIVLGNAWLYRWPLKPPPNWELPPNFEFELRDLRRHPLTGQAAGEFLNVAAESFFADRFALDPRLDQKQVRRRFLAVVENGLAGEIADYAMIVSRKGRVEAFAFFGVSNPQSEMSSYPLAGKWLTLLARHSLRAQGLAHLLIAESIRRLPAGKANWTCACALNNLSSLQTAQKLNFRIGAIAYDLHRWREPPVV